MILATAQARAAGIYTVEHPESALSWQDALRLIALYRAIRKVCADGAPWLKPMALCSNDARVLQFHAECP